MVTKIAAQKHPGKLDSTQVDLSACQSEQSAGVVKTPVSVHLSLFYNFLHESLKFVSPYLSSTILTHVIAYAFQT